ncbi:MAG: DUF6773 family protein [Eubacteriales bacterium]
MKKIEDERIITEKRRINSSAFGICFLALWGILIYRQVILKQDMMEYIDIFLLVMGLSIYILVNNVCKGFYLTYRNNGEKRKIMYIGAFVGSITFILVQSLILKYDFTKGSDIFTALISLGIFFTVWVFVQSRLFKISETKADKESDDE